MSKDKLRAYLKESAKPLEGWEEFKQEMRTFPNPTTPGTYRVQVIAVKDSAMLPNGLKWVNYLTWEWKGFWLNEQGIKVTDPSCIKGWEKIEHED